MSVHVEKELNNTHAFYTRVNNPNIVEVFESGCDIMQLLVELVGAGYS